MPLLSFKKTALVLFLAFTSAICNSQISFVSNCSPYPNYTVNVSMALVSFTKTNNGGGCNINISVAYTVSVNGSIPNGWCGGGSGGSLNNLHVNFSCSGGNFEAHLPHTAGTGTVCACNNQGVSGNAACAALTLNSYCSTPVINVQIGGPGINTNGNYTPPGILPVELMYFTAATSGHQTNLAWATATEHNNSHFTIERSSDGLNWEALGTVKGAGNSEVKQSYAYTDESPLPGINYYRLKQSDFNSDYNYSGVEYVEFLNKTMAGSVVFPNPTTSELNLHVSTSSSEDIISDIYDATGRFLSSQKISRTAELTKAMLSMPQASGIYFIVVSQAGQVISRHRVCVNPQ
jgi:hypothetical protein